MNVLRRAGPRIELICVGTELLSGKINSHGAYFSALLRDRGLSLALETTVSDDPAEMARAFRDAWRRSDVVVTTGGLGPTFDDLTREVWAKVLGRRLVFRGDLLDTIRRRFEARGMAMPATNRRQAFAVDGGRILANPHGTAPGQSFSRGAKAVFLFPGPGRELRPMVESFLLPFLNERFPRPAGAARTWRLFGLRESAVDAQLPALMKKGGGRETWGILAQSYVVDVKAAVPGARAEERISEIDRGLKKLFGAAVFGGEGETLEGAVGKLLREKGKTLAVAESCTGGLLGAKVTSVPGSSEYFWGGWLTYDNAAKRRLGVKAATLNGPGAVSARCAREMAASARRAAGADYALAVTGIAGPDGGSVGKPVGLVFTALAAAEGTRVWKNMFLGKRDAIREQSALWALDGLRRRLLKVGRAGRRPGPAHR